MICYLVRHGKDDESVRGGWNDSLLIEEGVRQVERLSLNIRRMNNVDVGTIYSSDLPRAKQTAEILSSALSVSVIETPDFREVNNGVLAGMNNQMAERQFPGLYWNTLEWEQPYPGGESPCQFYNRISRAWQHFKNIILEGGHNVILVTHGGVIDVILHIVKGLEYSNRAKPFSVKHAEIIAIEI